MMMMVICVAVCRICRRILVFNKFAILYFKLHLSILIVFLLNCNKQQFSNISMIPVAYGGVCR